MNKETPALIEEEDFTVRYFRFHLDLVRSVDTLRASDSLIRAVVVPADDLDLLAHLLADYHRLLDADERRREQARAKGRKGGRPRAKKPAPGTLRSRKSRARKASP